jgi:hypothetical protein
MARPQSSLGSSHRLRFLSVESKDDGPAFFGHHARYGHKVYGAVLVNLRAPNGVSE